MEGNALELVQKGKMPTWPQAKEFLAERWQGKVKHTQEFAVAVWVAQQVCREESRDFPAYMLDVYDYDRAAAYRYAQAGGVLLNLSTAVDKEWLPQAIIQAAMLASLPKEQQIAVWDSLLDKYEPKKITQQIVADHVAMLKGIPAPPADVQETESPVVQETEPAEAELVEDDEPEDDGPEFDEMEEAEESAPPALPVRPTHNAVSNQFNFPPLGCELRILLKLLAVGLKLVRIFETSRGSVIYQWTGGNVAGGWQEIHAGSARQVEAYWEKLLQSKDVIDC